jgi:hypothetical protein
MNNLAGISVSGVEISGVQTGKWTFENSPYIVSGNIEVPENTTLTIESGVVVKFAGDYSIKVQGTLVAIGNVGRRIIFTSVHDKEFGITSKPTTIMPTNKDWVAIEFAPSSKNLSGLDYCIIRYSDKAITAPAANPKLNHIIIADCNTKNLMINGKSVVVMEGSEQNYTPIESTLDENILISAMPKTTIEQPKATLAGKNAESVSHKKSLHLEK